MNENIYFVEYINNSLNKSSSFVERIKLFFYMNFATIAKAKKVKKKKQENKSLTIELVTWTKVKYFSTSCQ